MEINSYTPYIPSTDNSNLSQTKLEKAYTAITLQREKKVFNDAFLKARKSHADKTVKKVFQHMIEEIANIIS